MVSKTYLTVRYAETDMMGIVYHSRYYPWFEVARSDFIKECGIPYSEVEKAGVYMPLIETGARYIQGLTYDDKVLVECSVVKLSVVRCEFSYKVYKLPDMVLCTEGMTSHAFTGKDLRPVNLKKKFPQIWEIIQKSVEE